jgi:hypothetical protein
MPAVVPMMAPTIAVRLRIWHLQAHVRPAVVTLPVPSRPKSKGIDALAPVLERLDAG